ncbi:glycosyltransferase family 61 protein [Methylobacterium oryzihabitans]|uniref:Glycosyltransferase family 61 protein n=1 Tax=Methylobacterium oryzihabitans TaxID=2499852 RepID=A0A437PE71_9HYPH|nr:glycosyltransferase family 61 protein [Methylobacterium oryzihabitans]RVU20578.1 glycosyltransferase family 61 protein [Methylobacterium oryzihabitans]
MSLRPCTVASRIRIRRGLPAVRTLEGALYLPHSAARGRPSGLFDGDRRCVPESVDRRGRRGEPAWQRTDWPDDLPPEVPVAPEDAYLFLGGAHMHYGHFVINTVPRFWPLLDRDAKRPPILCYAPATEALWQPFRFAIDILARLGLAPRDVAAFDEPRILRRVVVPAPALQEEAFAHPVYRDLCLAIGAGCYAPDEVDRDERPAYLAKTRLAGGVRRIDNEDEVVAVLERGGVEIVHPEAMSFSEQVRLFATRRVVLGSVGSALHTAIFAPPGRRVIGLSHAPRINPTFRLVDVLAGNRVAYLHQPGTEDVGGSGFSVRHRLPDPRGAAEDLLRWAEAMRADDRPAGLVERAFAALARLRRY